MTEDFKGSIRGIIERLTVGGHSIFSEKVFYLAAELGIGDRLVQECLQQLIDERFVMEPVAGVLRRV